MPSNIGKGLAYQGLSPQCSEKSPETKTMPRESAILAMPTDLLFRLPQLREAWAGALVSPRAV
jgi:hypothetical protein